MNDPKPAKEIKAVAVATADDLRIRIKQKSKLKGRQADDASLAEVKKLIGNGPYRRDLLIENLHLINDAYRALHERHLAALAKLMNLPMAEVYKSPPSIITLRWYEAMIRLPILRFVYVMDCHVS